MKTSPSGASADDAAPERLLFQLATGHFVAAALQTVAVLRVADHLADGPRSTGTLAESLSVDEDALYRVLRALATVGMFDEVEARTFALTPAGQRLRSDVPGSFHRMTLWITSPFHFRVYAELIHAVRTGEPAAERITGTPVFEYLTRDPALSAIFNDAMSGMSELVVPAVLQAYDFGGIDVLVDVGGGHGALLTAILQQYPTMRGVLLDQEHVLVGARERIGALGLQDRCTIDAGSFFERVPAGGDAYIMKHIIHDWDDDRALTILRHIRVAMGAKRGRVLLVESVIPPGNTPDLGKLMDLEMLMMVGGRERTAAEFSDLFTRAGFEMTRIIPTESPLAIVEARRAD